MTAEEKLFPQHYYKKPERSTAAEKTQDKKPEQKEFSTIPMTEEEKLIHSGENTKLEFKSSLRWNIIAKRPDKGIEHSAVENYRGIP